MKIGELIKEYRIINNLSRAEFGRRIGCTREYIRQIEEYADKGYMISLDKIDAIAKELNIPYEQVLKSTFSKQEYKNKTYYKIYVNKQEFRELIK